MPRISLPAAHLTRLQSLAALLAEQGVSGWLVGGYLRDLLLGHPGHDIDVAVDGPAHALARALADGSGGAFVSLDEPTDSARVVWPAAEGTASFMLDLVRLRAPTITADLGLRDFTVNALAVPLEAIVDGSFDPAALLDPTGGRADLQRRVIALCGPRSLQDDPLRMLRAVRIAAQLGFTVPADVTSAITNLAPRIADVAAERVRDELLKLLMQPQAAEWLVFLDRVRLLTRIIPELEAARGLGQPSQHFLPVLDHLFESVRAWEWLFGQLAGYSVLPGPAAVRRHPRLPGALPRADALVARMRDPLMAEAPRGALFKLAVLLHDIGKPATRQVRPDGRITFYDHQEVGAQIVGGIAKRLRLSREATAYIQLIVREHMRPGQLRALGPDLTRRALYRFMRDTGAVAPDVLLHTLCDHMAARGPYLSPPDWAHHLAWTAAVLGEEWMASEERQSQRLATGRDLIDELGLTPGPLIGRLLAAIDEAQFVGEVQTRAAALELAARIAREQPGAES